MQEKKKLLILLTRLPGVFSSLVTLCTGSYYTHVSIGFEEDKNTFYSFLLKGFVVEKIHRYLKPEREPFPCVLYEIEVDEAVYQDIRSKVETFKQNKHLLHYTRIGVMFGFMHILFSWENHYYCSQFVGELLTQNHVVEEEPLYMPKHFTACKEMKQTYVGNLEGMFQQIVVTS